MSNEYKLVKLSDILEIPADRLDAFLPELKEWILLSRDMDETFRTIAEVVNEPYQPDFYMNWIDDGKTEKKIVVTIKDQPPTNQQEPTR